MAMVAVLRFALSLSPLFLRPPVCRVRGELKVQTANWMCPKGSGPPPSPPSSRKREGRGRRKEGKAVEKTTDLSAAFYLGKDER